MISSGWFSSISQLQIKKGLEQEVWPPDVYIYIYSLYSWLFLSNWGQRSRKKRNKSSNVGLWRRYTSHFAFWRKFAIWLKRRKTSKKNECPFPVFGCPQFWVTTCNPLAVDSTEGNGAPYWLLAEHTLGRGPLAQCQVGRVGVIWDCVSQCYNSPTHSWPQWHRARHSDWVTTNWSYSPYHIKIQTSQVTIQSTHNAPGL